MEKKLYLGKSGEVPALLRIPDEGSEHPAVIMCHGTGSDKNEVGGLFQKLAEMLEAEGIASIRMDFADCGERIGKGEVLTFLDEVVDVEYAYSYLMSLTEIDSTRIAILGFSQGARVMAEFLGRQKNLSCAVSWSGTCHNGEGIYAAWFREYYEQAYNNGFASMPLAWREDLHFSVEWFEEIRSTEPMTSLEKYKGPVLALAGDADAIVPSCHAEEIAAAGKNVNSRAFIIAGADHTFNVLLGKYDASDFVLSNTVRWFKKYI